MVVAVVRGRCFDRSRITSFLCSVNRKMLHFLGVTVILGILSVRPFPLHSSTRLAFVCYRYLLRCKLFFYLNSHDQAGISVIDIECLFFV